MFCVCSVASFTAADSDDCWDSSGIEGGDRAIRGGSKATDNNSVHSFRHGRSGLLAILLCWTSSLMIVLCSLMSFLLFLR